MLPKKLLKFGWGNPENMNIRPSISSFSEFHLYLPLPSDLCLRATGYKKKSAECQASIPGKK